MRSRLRPLHEKERPGEVKHAYSTVAKSIRLLEYKTTFGFRSGLERMVQWAKSVGPQEPSYTIPLEITKNAPRIWLKKLM
jgi:hypothetical protein